MLSPGTNLKGMTMEDLDIIEERDGYRVRLQRDESPEQPYDDGATPIFTVEHSRWGGYRLAEAFNKQAEPYLDAVAEILRRHDMETLERFVKIFYGAARMDSWYSEGLEGHYVAFDTAAWREKVGAPEESLKEEYYLSEVRAWAEGDVWGYIVEKQLRFEKRFFDPEDAEVDYGYEDGTEWIEVDGESCWGFYGREYAEQSAKEALDNTLENA